MVNWGCVETDATEVGDTIAGREFAVTVEGNTLTSRELPAARSTATTKGMNPHCCKANQARMAARGRWSKRPCCSIFKERRNKVSLIT